MEVGGQRHDEARSTRGRHSVNCTGGWVGPAGRFWTGAENLAPQLGFDPRTVQPVAVRNYGW